ncbi:hypothetical protein MRX96_046047 [Rhipicephalus microplus]
MGALSALQNSMYVLIEHGTYHRCFLRCGVLCVTMIIMQELALRLIGQSIDNCCWPLGKYGNLSTQQW